MDDGAATEMKIIFLIQAANQLINCNLSPGTFHFAIFQFFAKELKPSHSLPIDCVFISVSLN